ncbi:DUF397 domain-containing protein [Actinoplanes sp. N902-109]|uniref:DUF397 domain-containing protein n=1 Tax=Actinoplanes sp. (strain N902-109) TaxID=649831 RepID=UPI0003293A20|nr:DUF397 domain-containing protein [Actinoplanes sp. N902-109]AGL20852.1 hypothetical protein L083_7342 [Actinoplanes sp. N902-109]
MDLSHAHWKKSTRSGIDSNCVEVTTNLPAAVAVRDTKNRQGGTLLFTHAEWQAFIEGAKAGEFDL